MDNLPALYKTILSSIGRMSTFQTEYGLVDINELIRGYNIYRRNDARNQERRREFLQTDRGKEYNRERAKAYYERNKETILEKRKKQYQEKNNS